ncbi:MAG: sulfatase [Opitutia bacterium Tous-C1TDCM]|nr:MAG: sulfatase [Opitutae bacterium Tous-C1TDCM]
MHPASQFLNHLTRRQFFAGAGLAMGGIAMNLLASRLRAAGAAVPSNSPLNSRVHPPLAGFPHFAPRAKRIIYLHMNGGPSQLDTFDYKPKLQEQFDVELPDSIRQGQRITTMTSGQTRFPVAPSLFKFAQHGQSGTWVSDLLPWTAKLADEISVVRSVHTNAINHDPACTFLMTGSEIPGKASIGSWLSYGLGSDNNDLPAFVVLTPKFSSKVSAQALFTRMWSSGFLPTSHNGVALRASGDPVLFIQNPDGVDAGTRRAMLDSLNKLNDKAHARYGDPETITRIAQYEMAFRMQTSVPELTDFSGESPATLELYGDAVKQPGSFTASCLLARRLAERNVRVVQILHRGWDQHGNLPSDHRLQCQDVDRACYALITDLKQRGLLDDTLVVWAGEFGRTVYSQGTLTKTNYGRDHHPRCFSVWLAGGGVKRGHVHGETDDFSYNIVRDPVSLHDLNATLLHCLGIDHLKFSYKSQGLDQRLTGVEPAQVVKQILA